MPDIEQEFCALEDLCDRGQALIERMCAMHPTQEERLDRSDFGRSGIPGREAAACGK